MGADPVRKRIAVPNIFCLSDIHGCLDLRITKTHKSMRMSRKKDIYNLKLYLNGIYILFQRMDI